MPLGSGKPDINARWQTVCILLPVLLTAAFGFHFIWKDRQLVEEEARQRAAEWAAALAAHFARQFPSELSQTELTSNAWLGDGIIGGRIHWPGTSPLDTQPDGRAVYLRLYGEWQAKYPAFRAEDVFPVTYHLSSDWRLTTLPEPAKWLRQLSPAQHEDWLALQHVLQRSTDTDEIAGAIETFRAGNPPAGAVASAEFAGLLRSIPGLPPEARVDRLIQFGGSHGYEVSEAGVPLITLALARALREAAQTTLTEDLFDAVSGHLSSRKAPSLFSPHLLDQLDQLAARAGSSAREAVLKLRVRRTSGERFRDIASTLWESTHPNPATVTNLWLDHDHSRWFALIEPALAPDPSTPPQLKLRLFPKTFLEAAAAVAISQSPERLPPYLRPSISLEGEVIHGRLTNAPAAARPIARETAALSQKGIFIRDGTESSGDRREEIETFPSQPRFTLELHLTDRALLYAQADRRAWTFAALILTATAAALAGLARMRQALARQQRLNELKTNFVSSVSHELRAPIASIRLMAEAIESGRVRAQEKQSGYFRFIVQECGRLSALIENVLDFSRIEQGRKQFEFEPTDVVALVRDSVRLMERSAEQKQVRLEFGPVPEAAAQRLARDNVFADGGALRQALLNLIDNAIKHSPAGSSVVIRIDLAPPPPGRSQNGAWLRLEVQDEGEGIPPDEHERIFERFYRRGSELRRDTQGAGIGLSIVKHIAEAHRGRVTVDSAPGRGSRFVFEFPMAPDGITGSESSS